MDFRKIFLASILYFGIICNYLTYAIMAPFFPKLALEKGLSTMQYSLVFTVYSVAQLVSSIFIGRSLAHITPKYAICAGLFLSGGATVLFGCLESVEDATSFFILCIFARVLEGCGFSAYLTSCLSVLITQFPHIPASITGLAEMFVTVAMICGPPIGGILYTVGGYHCPFVVFGVIMLLMTGLTYVIVPSQTPSNNGSISLAEYKKFLSLPEAWMNVICVSMNVMADAFITISLVEFMSQFSSLSAIQMGGVFLCLFLSYGVSAPLSGWMADKWKIEYQLQSLGCIVLAISFAILGPASFVNFQPKVWLVVLSLLVKGIGAGPLISCSLSSALRAALKNAKTSDEKVKINNLVSSSVTFSIPFGNVLGSTLSGTIYSELGMPLSCTIFFTIFLALGFILIIMAAQNACNRNVPERQSLVEN